MNAIPQPLFESLEARKMFSTGHLVADISPGATNSMPSEFVNFNGQAYFTVGYDFAPSVAVWALWKTDGTAAGTTRVSEPVIWNPFGTPIEEQPNVNGPLSPVAYGRGGIQDLTVIGDRIWALDFKFVTTHTASVRLRSFASDGTSTLTQLGGYNTSSYGEKVTSIKVVNGRPLVGIEETSVAQGMVWYTVDDDGSRLIVDPSDAPSSFQVYTTVNHDLLTFPGNGSTATAANGERFYAYNDGVHGIELWARNARDVVTTPMPYQHPAIEGASVSTPAGPRVRELVELLEMT